MVPTSPLEQGTVDILFFHLLLSWPLVHLNCLTAASFPLLNAEFYKKPSRIPAAVAAG
jgi:hypothetical protein